MSLPVGTVVFLFTDIEGSTQLWEKHPEAMSAALARHDDLIRSAVKRQGGIVFKTVGDAFCVVFETAPDAIHAAVRAQRLLVEEPWHEEISLRVRMAVHAGAAEYRDEDYFGPALNRVARLLGIGHGGQILLSQAAYHLSRDHTFDSLLMLPLGEHRLRDLSRPESVYQLQHPRLPADFPPLRSLNHPDLPNNLPPQMTSFVGRTREIGAIRDLLARNRLLTLTGSGGVGKTRLALHVAAENLDGFPDGVWYVELAQLTEETQLPREILSALGVREDGGQSVRDTLVDSLRPRKALLLLDNCEHLVEAVARLTDLILRACPSVKILATSREPLNTSGEHTYRVPSLALPNPRRDTNPEALNQFEAVRLFIDRASQARPGFTVTNANAPALASVCARLDGIPLAIELAAARARTLNIEEIEGRLDDTFRLLTGGNRTALKRQQTLRAAIDWSHELLSETEQTLFRRLAIFSGGWSLPAAEAVTAWGNDPPEAWEILDLLTSLMDKSLVVTEVGSEGTRYRFLETVRQYGAEKLRESGEGDEASERHGEWCCTLAAEASRNLRGPQQGQWLDRLETDYDNVRNALNVALEKKMPMLALRLACFLRGFWVVRGYWTEGLNYLSVALALPDGGNPSPNRPEAVNTAGVLAMRLGDLARAETWLSESLALCRQSGDSAGVVSALLNLGNAARLRGQFEQARECFAQGSEENRALGNRAGEAYNRQMLGIVLTDLNLCDEAKPHLEAALAIHRETGDRFAEAVVLDSLGALNVQCARYELARDYYDRALSLAREIGYREEELCWLSGNATIARRTGDNDRAVTLFRQALDEAERMGSRQFIGQTLEDLASLLALSGEADRATRVFGFEAGLRKRVGYHFSPTAQEEHEATLKNLRASLGEAAFQNAWAAGGTMPLEEALALARA